MLGDHHDAFFALFGDALGPLGAGLAENFAEAGFSGLDLPGLGGTRICDGEALTGRVRQLFRI